MTARKPINIHIQNDARGFFAPIQLTLVPGEITCIVGESGCGKTSLLRLIAGLDACQDTPFQRPGNSRTPPLWRRCLSSLRIVKNPAYDDARAQSQAPSHEAICHAAPDHASPHHEASPDQASPHHEVSVAYMSQLPTLVPWLSVLDNLCLRQRLDGTAPDQRTRAIELLDRVGLISIAMAYPHTLSVGMQQRICLLRTVLQDKPVVLLDEPFSALDHDTRVDLQNLLVQLLPTAAILMVTHDWLDVLRLAHVVYTLKGRPARLMPVAIALPDHPVPRPVPLDALPFLAAEQKRPQPSSAGVAL